MLSERWTRSNKSGGGFTGSHLVHPFKDTKDFFLHSVSVLSQLGHFTSSLQFNRLHVVHGITLDFLTFVFSEDGVALLDDFENLGFNLLFLSISIGEELLNLLFEFFQLLFVLIQRDFWLFVALAWITTQLHFLMRAWIFDSKYSLSLCSEASRSALSFSKALSLFLIRLYSLFWICTRSLSSAWDSSSVSCPSWVICCISLL